MYDKPIKKSNPAKSHIISRTEMVDKKTDRDKYSKRKLNLDLPMFHEVERHIVAVFSIYTDKFGARCAAKSRW